MYAPMHVVGYDPHDDPHYQVLLKAKVGATNAQCISTLNYAVDILGKAASVAKGGLLERNLGQGQTIQSQIDAANAAIYRLKTLDGSAKATQADWDLARFKTLGALSQYSASIEGRAYQNANFDQLLDDLWEAYKKAAKNPFSLLPWWAWVAIGGGALAAATPSIIVAVKTIKKRGAK